MDRLVTSRQRAVIALLTCVFASTTARAVPEPGRAMPTLSARDLRGEAHSEREFNGHWTVAIAVTDKDIGPLVDAWWRALDAQMPHHVRRVSLVALDLFGMIPTSLVFSEAREAAPASRWSSIWLCRDGTLARQLDAPESETPWVLVVDPDGRVAARIHATVSADGVARVLQSIAR